MTMTSCVINCTVSFLLYEENTVINKSVYCVMPKKGIISTEFKTKEFRFKLSLKEEYFNKNI